MPATTDKDGKVLCGNWLRMGKCDEHAAGTCNGWHPQFKTGNRGVCKHFQYGRCWNGDKCDWEHFAVGKELALQLDDSINKQYAKKMAAKGTGGNSSPGSPRGSPSKGTGKGADSNFGKGYFQDPWAGARLGQPRSQC